MEGAPVRDLLRELAPGAGNLGQPVARLQVPRALCAGLAFGRVFQAFLDADKRGYSLFSHGVRRRLYFAGARIIAKARQSETHPFGVVAGNKRLIRSAGSDTGRQDGAGGRGACSRAALGGVLAPPMAQKETAG